MNRDNAVHFGESLLILPAVALGVLAMIHGGVSPALWGQQMAAWALLALTVRPLRRVAGRISDGVWSAALLLLLAASLFGQAVAGARRWVNLMVFHANAAQLVLPALIVLQCRGKWSYPVLLGAATVLSLQPDLSQLAALGAAVLVTAPSRSEKKLWKAGALVLLGLLVVFCLRTPIVIEQVAYCEGILGMLGDISWLLAAAGGVSLGLIPTFFGYRFCRQGDKQALALAAYYAVSMLFALSGAYPVPFMGFGLSPIAGYYLVCICTDMTGQNKAIG